MEKMIEQILDEIKKCDFRGGVVKNLIEITSKITLLPCLIDTNADETFVKLIFDDFTITVELTAKTIDHIDVYL
jgi:hypothetical protein